MTNIPAFNADLTKKHILIAPLDWGWGHTLRCVPLIRQWLQAGHTVTIACNATQQHILAPLCPAAIFVNMHGYDITYGRTGFLTKLSLLAQLPKIYRKIHEEQQWLQAHLQEHRYDMIVSDNRYGFHAKGTPCMFITHQLAPISGLGSLVDQFVAKRIKTWIEAFQECWIPDVPPPNNFSGKLSKAAQPLSIPTHYIGILSRFEKPLETYPPQTYMLALLSGPEPQRSILERKILQDALQHRITIKLVRGTYKKMENAPTANHIEIFEAPSIDTLSQLITHASLVIGRSGYTSILDYAILQPKVVFIPTPGQAEQRYLAEHLQKLGIAPYLHQQDFSLRLAQRISNNFTYHWPTQTPS